LEAIMATENATVFIGGTLGTLAAGLLALPMVLPLGLQAQEPWQTLNKPSGEIFSPGPSLHGLVHREVRFEPGVSQDVVREVVVRKIAYGQTSFVTVGTTPTGTYSSDAIGSAHIRYPGVHVTPITPAAAGSGLAFVAEGPVWRAIPAVAAGSFVQVNAFPGGTVTLTDAGACVAMANAVYC
jgi:hypothetical protein